MGTPRVGRYHLPAIPRRSSWPSPKPEPPKVVCFGDLHRAELLARRASLPRPPGFMSSDPHESKLIEPWSEYRNRKRRERGLAPIGTEAVKTTEGGLTPDHIESMRRGQQRRRARERLAAANGRSSKPTGRHPRTPEKDAHGRSSLARCGGVRKRRVRRGG